MNYLLKSLIFLLCLQISFLGSAQIYRDDQQLDENGKVKTTALSGVLKEAYDITKPIPWAKVQLKGSDVSTYADGRGFFVLGGAKAGGAALLIISADGYETTEFPVLIGGGEEVGVIYLHPLRRDLFPITVTDLMPSQPDNQNESFQTIGASALWQSFDVLAESSSFGLGMLGFRPRGYDWRNTSVYINGANVNQDNTGYADIRLLAGMNSLTNKGEGSTRILSDLPFFNDLGGVSHTQINPLQHHQQFKMAYSRSNALFSNQLSVAYNTGTMASGWAMSILGSARNGASAIEGSKYEGYSYMIAAAKEIDESQYFSFYVAGAPTTRGMQTYSNALVQELTDNVHYNASSGKDAGSDRNAREQKYHIPTMGLMYSWDMWETSLLRTSLNLSKGVSASSTLNWTGEGTNPWSDFDVTNNPLELRMPGVGVLWNDMRAANDTLKQARYIRESDNIDQSMLSFNAVYDVYDWGNLGTTVGLDLKISNNIMYQKIDDLLGANYWLDRTRMPSGLLLPPNFNENNIDFPGNQMVDGARIGYDYTINQSSYKLFNVWRYYYNKFKLTAGGQVGYTSFAHKANLHSGRVERQEGKTNQNFLTYAFKTGVAYKIDKRSDVELNTMQSVRAPLYSDAYLDPRLNDAMAVNKLKKEKVMGMELNYGFVNSVLEFRASGFFTRFEDQIRTRSYFDPSMNSRMNLTLSDLNQQHFGFDVSAKYNLSRYFKVRIAGSYGVYKYNSDPIATLHQSNLNHRLVDGQTVQMNGIKLGSTPGMAFTAGIMYDSPQRWWIGTNLNYAGNSYAEVNPLNYLVPVLQNSEVEVESELVFPDQEKLKASMSLNLFGGYTFEFGEKKIKALGLNVNLQNTLNNKGHLGAYQPFGIDRSIDPKENTRYAYILGQSLFLTLSFRF